MKGVGVLRTGRSEVRHFWRRREEAELASRLERRRQRANPDFVNELAREIRSTGRRRLVPSRLLLAAVLTVMMLVAAASVGGVSASAGVHHQIAGVFKTVKQIAGQQGSASLRSNDDDDDDRGVGGGRGDDDDDGDDDQYEEDGQECELALQQAHASFHQQSYTLRGHRLYHLSQAGALDDCDEIDDDDD
jgi:hypothetical protein